MKINPLLLLFALVLSVIIVSCVTRNPDHSPGAPAYVVDPRLATASNAVTTGIAVTAPVNPYAGLTELAAGAALAIITAVSTHIATSKSKQATIDAMAAGVVKAGAGKDVLEHASESPKFAAVAKAINDNTGANQTSTGEKSNS